MLHKENSWTTRQGWVYRHLVSKTQYDYFGTRHTYELSEARTNLALFATQYDTRPVEDHPSHDLHPATARDGYLHVLLHALLFSNAQ